jgi:glycosyltransferase involved in cell wall biosynthesis
MGNYDNELEKYFNNYKFKNQIVTLFLTTHCRPEYLKIAIDSVLRQSYKNYYLIILDNMSGDNTKDIVEEFNDDRLIYIERESTIEMNNYQFAFSICKTKYLVVFHDDDIIESDYLNEVLNVMENTDYVALSVFADLIDGKGNIIKKHKAIDNVISFSGVDYFKALIKKESCESMVFPAAIYRHSFYNDIFKFSDQNCGPAGDQFIWLQTERYSGKFAIYNKVLIQYRMHNGQDSSQNAGVMELKLLNYLYNDEYYKQLIMENSLIFKNYLWYCYKGLVVNYVRNHSNIREWFLINTEYGNISKECKKIYKKFRFTYKNFALTMFVFKCGFLFRDLFRRINCKKGK